MKETKKTSLRELRESKGMTVETLALKSGISSVEISAIEKGTRVPWTGTIRKLADALGVDFEDLYGSLQKA